MISTKKFLSIRTRISDLSLKEQEVENTMYCGQQKSGDFQNLLAQPHLNLSLYPLVKSV